MKDFINEFCPECSKEIQHSSDVLQMAAYFGLTLKRPGLGLVLKWHTVFNPSVKVHLGKSPGPFQDPRYG